MKDTEGPLGRAMEEPSRLPSTCKTSITFKVDRTSESLRAEGEEIHSKRQVKDNYELICWFQILFPACLSSSGFGIRVTLASLDKLGSTSSSIFLKGWY